MSIYSGDVIRSGVMVIEWEYHGDIKNGGRMMIQWEYPPEIVRRFEKASHVSLPETYDSLI